jgi:WD40 repeat protein
MSQAGRDVKAIFTAALEHPPGAERQNYLAEACGANAELRRRVGELLTAHAQASDVLGPSGPPATAVTSEATTKADEAAGAFESTDSGLITAHADSEATKSTRGDTALGGNGDCLSSGARVRYFGDYEIRRELGRGAMGIVYEARQVSLNRLVIGMANIDNPAFRPNGVEVWDLASGKIRDRLEGHTAPAFNAVFSPDGRRIASAGYDTTARIWDADTGRVLFASQGHHGCINSLAFSPDSRWVASTSDGNSAKIWDVESGRELLHLRGHSGPVWGAAFSPDGRRLVTSGEDGDLKIFDAKSSREAVTIAAHTGRVNGVVFSPDSLQLVSCGMDHALRGWDVNSCQLRAIWNEHTDPVWRAAFSPDGRFLVSVAGDWRRDKSPGEILMREASTGRVLYTRKAHRGIARAVAFSPDGRHLATGGGELRTPNQDVILWEAVTCHMERSFPKLPGGVFSLAFTPDGRRVVASGGGTIQAWQVETGLPEGTFADGNEGVGYIDVSPDGGVHHREHQPCGDQGLGRPVRSPSPQPVRTDIQCRGVHFQSGWSPGRRSERGRDRPGRGLRFRPEPGRSPGSSRLCLVRRFQSGSPLDRFRRPERDGQALGRLPGRRRCTVRRALLLAPLAVALAASAGCGNPDEGSISLKSSGFDRFKQPAGPRREMPRPATRSSKNARSAPGHSGRSTAFRSVRSDGFSTLGRSSP